MGSRKTGRDLKRVYDAADTWVDSALRSDGSLFTPDESIWSREMLGELHRRFLDSPDAGAGSFYEKLEVQLAGSPPEVFQLMAEVLYIHFLIVWRGAMKRATKEKGINQVLAWSLRDDIRIPDALIAAQSTGIAHPGIAFGTYRPYQVGLIIEFVEQWKEHVQDEQNRLLNDPWAFKDFANGIRFSSVLLKNNQNTPRIQREALFHLVFPESFEGIVSVEHKNSIAQADAFARHVIEPTDDVDRKIQQIRQGLEREVGRDINFYDDEMREIWDPAATVSNGFWDEFVGYAQAYANNGGIEGERYKLDNIVPSVVAAREAVLQGKPDWDSLTEKAVRNHLINWQNLPPFIRGIEQSPDEAFGALKDLWAEHDVSVVERIRAFCEQFPWAEKLGKGSKVRNISVLLMGIDPYRYPPFMPTRFESAYERTQYDSPPSDADEATLYEHALGFLDRFIIEASKRGLTLLHRLDAQGAFWLVTGDYEELPIAPTSSLGNDSPSFTSRLARNLTDLANDLTLPIEFLQETQTLLDDKQQVIFQGPPGTGKTYVARELAKHLAGSKERVMLVQFHPTYSYEDFVRGYRPTLVNGQAGFTLRDGPLVRAANAANQDKDNKHFLIIDEINRGNLAGVFGELYFLLEYRDEEISLQYSEEDEKFSLPDNLYIIGTMNTADRSIALVDLALRRRFYFVEFHPDDEPIDGLLRRWLNTNGLGGMDWVANVVDCANELLRDDRHAAIGPSYFMKDDLDVAAVERIWKHSVLPYIEERLFGQDGRLGEFQLDMLCGRAQDGSGNAENEATVASESDTESDSGGE